LDYELFYGNLESPSDVDAATKGVDTVLHIAGIQKSLNIIDRAIENGVTRFILVHTTGIYSKYKAAGEEYRLIEEQIYKKREQNKSISLTILRPTMIYGSPQDANMSKFIKLVDKFRIVPVVRGGKYWLQPVNAKDIGEAYYKVLIHPKETANKDYILSGGTKIMLIDILRLIAKELGVKRSFISVPFWFAYAGGVALYILSFGRIDFRERIQRLCEDRAFDHTEAARDFGYAPMAFKDGLAEEVLEIRS
jgi:nucleoside-diphosphate-sugar epimerase